MKRILFQGDSITDCGRDRNSQANPNSHHALGSGYAGHIAARLLADRPSDELEIFNRGISGNRVVDLYARWKCDALNLKPDLISILIGVNDTWHEFGSQNGVEPARYEQVYRMLVEYTRQMAPETKIVFCEPFVLPCGVVTPDWVTEMNERRAIVARLAKEFGGVFVPFQSMFDEACNSAPCTHWAPDGVHPSPAGHMRMADLWLKNVFATWS